MFLCNTLHSHIVSVKDVMKRWEGEGGACNPRWTTLPFTESSDTFSRFLLKRNKGKIPGLMETIYSRRGNNTKIKLPFVRKNKTV